MTPEKEAAIVVDYQNAFIPVNEWWTGEVEVKWGWDISWRVNEETRRIKNASWLIITSVEEHKEWSVAFASSYVWKEPLTVPLNQDREPGSENFITLDEVKEKWEVLLSPKAKFTIEELIIFLETAWDNQAVWEDHCVKDTKSANFYEKFDTSLVDVEVVKWTKINEHPFSAFEWRTRDWKMTTLEVLKKEKIREISIFWLAIEFCDLETVMDAVKNWFKVNPKFRNETQLLEK